MKVTLKMSLISSILFGGLFFIFPNVSFAQFITDPSVVGQYSYDSASDVIVGTDSWTARIGNGYSASTTGVNIYASTTIITSGQNFRVDINGYSNSNYTGAVSTCVYDSQGIALGYHAPGIIALNVKFQETGGGCVLKSNIYYEIDFSFSSYATAISQLYGVNQSVEPFDVTSNDINLGVPFVMIKAVLSSLDPNLIQGGNPSGISTSTIQAYCSNSYATSTGFFSDLSNAVSYGACTALAFLFVPNQNTLSDFNDLKVSATEHIPFSYYYDIKSVFDDTASSTGSNFVDIEFDISSSTVCTTSFGCIIPSVTAFSTSTISTYISDSTRSILRTLMASVVWLAFAYYAYGVVTRTLSKSS